MTTLHHTNTGSRAGGDPGLRNTDSLLRNLPRGSQALTPWNAQARRHQRRSFVVTALLRASCLASVTPSAFAICVVVSAAPSAGQNAVHVDAAPACANCDLRVRAVQTVGRTDDAELIGDLNQGVALLSDGRILIAAASGRDGVLQYGPDSRFERMVGRPGPGPGELLAVAGVRVIRGDTILVFEIGRVSVFGATGNYVRSFPVRSLNAPHAVHVASDGTMVYTSQKQVQESRSFRFTRLDGNIQPVASFGEVAPDRLRSVCSLCATELATWSAARPDHFWSMPRDRYEIELWHEDGHRVMRLNIGSSWFTPWPVTNAQPRARRGTLPMGPPQTPVQASGTPPGTLLVGIREDSDGLLWITGRAPSRDWKPQATGQTVGGSVFSDVREHNRRYFDTIIDVIDPTRGVLLTSQRIEHTRLSPISANTWWSDQEDAAGVIQLVIHQIDLIRERLP